MEKMKKLAWKWKKKEKRTKWKRNLYSYFEKKEKKYKN